jgi:hypothetical protein
MSVACLLVSSTRFISARDNVKNISNGMMARQKALGT